MSPFAYYAPCPREGCMAMIVPDKHPKDKKSFDKTTRTWSFVCQRCGLEFSVKETELLKEVINPKRLLEEYPA
jgi:hypothetical protein